MSRLFNDDVGIDFFFAVVYVDHMLVAIPHFSNDPGVLHRFKLVFAKALVKWSFIVRIIDFFSFVATLNTLESVELKLLFRSGDPDHKVFALYSDRGMFVAMIFPPKSFESKNADRAELRIAPSSMRSPCMLGIRWILFLWFRSLASFLGLSMSEALRENEQ